MQAELPSGASAEGGPELRMTSSQRFTLTQDLRLDDWACGDRSAEIVLAAQLLSNGTFSVTVVSTYVGTGWGDAWGCRNAMWNKLDAAAPNAAEELESGLEQLVDAAFSQDTPRFYFVPAWGMTEFDLAGGGTTPPPPNQQF
jgi:hypothetical protein